MTNVRYIKVARKILATRESREIFSPHNMRKRSWFLRKAACKYFLASKILSDLTHIDKSKRDGDMAGAENALQWASWSMDFVKNKLSEKASFSPVAERKENRSKRRTLGSLPSSWPQKVFDAASDSLKRAVAIHFLSGCRPEELQKGVRIAKLPDGIEFTIFGAKVYRKGNAQVGQEERRILITYSSETERKMASVLSNGVTSYKKDTVRKGLLRLSKTLYPRHSRPVSSYNFRHLFSSKLKRSGISEEEIAMALGHSSCRTQSQYGTARQSSGGMSVSISASATTVPRNSGRRAGPDVSATGTGPSA